MFNPVASYRYLLPTVYVSVTDIANPNLLGVVVGPGLVSTSLAFMMTSSPKAPGSNRASGDMFS